MIVRESRSLLDVVSEGAELASREEEEKAVASQIEVMEIGSEERRGIREPVVKCDAVGGE